MPLEKFNFGCRYYCDMGHCKYFAKLRQTGMSSRQIMWSNPKGRYNYLSEIDNKTTLSGRGATTDEDINFHDRIMHSSHITL